MSGSRFFQCKRALDLLDYLQDKCISEKESFDKAHTVSKEGKWGPQSECRKALKEMEESVEKCFKPGFRK